MATGTSRGWKVSAGLLLLTSLVVGGPAAHAVFTSSVRSSGFTASTHTMAAPAGNVVVATCLPIGNSGKHRLDISVVTHGTVPKANAYVLVTTDPSGNKYPVTITGTDRKYSSNTASGGTWTYAVEAQYNVPGSTNYWRSSTPSPASVTC